MGALATTLGDRKLRRSFMLPGEAALIRRLVLRVSQDRLARALVRPDTGAPLTARAVSYYERGLRRIPLWVATLLHDLAQAARQYDAGLLRRVVEPKLDEAR